MSSYAVLSEGKVPASIGVGEARERCMCPLMLAWRVASRAPFFGVHLDP
jgi:hypothetical protein